MIFWNNLITVVVLTDFIGQHPFIDYYPRLLHVGCENPGVKIESISTMSGVPDEPGRRLQWTYRGKAHRIKSLDNLKYHVHINNQEMALQYVRLYTSSNTWYQCSTKERIIEIVNEKISNTIPTYGLSKKRPYKILSSLPSADKIDSDNDDPGILSGYFGVLSSEAYKHSYFEAPIVQSNRDSFVVTRWVLCYNLHHVEQIRENVGRNGSYSRYIVQRLPTPKLPNTFWYIPGFE